MPRRVAIVALPRSQPLDVAGPADVFAAVNVGLPGTYEIEVVAPGGAPLETGAGYALTPARALEDLEGPVDTLVVAGGWGARHAPADVVARIAEAAGRARRVASVCTGAFVLADAGLLDGRRAAALQVARYLVLFVKRPGGQSQFSAQLAAQAAKHAPLRELQAWIAGNLDADLSVPALAERAHMSVRHFARAFKAQTGQTPAAYVEALRVEAARLALESGDVPVETIAARCGFGTVETLRRTFARCVGVSPSAYRSRFAAAAA